MSSVTGTRRRFLGGLMSAGIAGLSLPVLPRLAAGQELPLTPSCDDDGDLTLAQTEGPYFTPNSPERTVLREEGMAGTPIILTGFVLTRSCRPIRRALVDLWHADDAGRYDNDGYRLRGHQFTDAAGRYRFETIVPGLYPGRTRHFHVKFQAPGEPVLTTQFYFPDEPGNERDRIFDAALLLDIDLGPEMTGRFDAVLDVA
jgi:protocatechuate 3,4-dioxygenase beta subunit